MVRKWSKRAGQRSGKGQKLSGHGQKLSGHGHKMFQDDHEIVRKWSEIVRIWYELAMKVSGKCGHQLENVLRYWKWPKIARKWPGNGLK